MSSKKYIDLEPLGKGGFGHVLKIKDLTNNEYRARKVILLDSKEKLETALNEVHIQQKLNHPNIIRIYDFMQINHPNQIELGIIMEYGDGRDLSFKIRNKRENKEVFEEIWILRTTLSICKAVEYCHRKGIIHKDIQPNNIVFVKGEPKLCDFGIARELENSDEYIRTKRLSKGYAAPEVLEDKQFRFKADIWSIGCILYEMCTLQRPFYPMYSRGMKYQLLSLKKYSLVLSALIADLLDVNHEFRPPVTSAIQRLHVLIQLKETQDNNSVLELQINKIEQEKNISEMKAKIAQENLTDLQNRVSKIENIQKNRIKRNNPDFQNYLLTEKAYPKEFAQANEEINENTSENDTINYYIPLTNPKEDVEMQI